MRRHASAIAGGRRKKDQKPIRHSNKDSIKVIKDSKKGDKDDFALDRSSQPSNHSKLKSRNDIEQKIDSKRRQVQNNNKGQRRSLSRSARKSSRENTEDRKKVAKKYKNFVNRLSNRESEVHDPESARSYRGLASGATSQYQYHVSNYD